MQIFGVLVNRDDTVTVVAADVVKQTRMFYVREKFAGWEDPRRPAFPYSERVDKSVAHLTARSALEAYMAKRQRDKENAKAVVAQATKQIASANELLMHLPPASSSDLIAAAKEQA